MTWRVRDFAPEYLEAAIRRWCPSRGVVVGVAVSWVDADREWEHRLLARGVRRITAMLPDEETGTAAFVNSGSS
jgi:hypothetical protein